jgi:hypothetical protein
MRITMVHRIVFHGKAAKPGRIFARDFGRRSEALFVMDAI